MVYKERTTKANKTAYYNQRIKDLGLTAEEAIHHGLDIDNNGNILQYIRSFNGNVIQYIPKYGKKRWQWNKIQSRSTSYNFHEEQFHEPLFITRYNPQFLQKKPSLGKYNYPAKNKTGLSVLPMPNNKAIEAIRSHKKGGMAFGTEGYFKVVAASVNGLEGVAFTGYSTYKVDEILKDYLLKRNLDDFIILYDSDATNVSSKGSVITTKRPKGFLNSAFKFSVAFFRFCKEHGLKTKLHFAEISQNQSQKGLDDLFQKAKEENKVEEVVEAFRSMQTSKYFNFLPLSLETCHDDLLTHFYLDSPLSFLNKHIEKIRPEGGFRFNKSYVEMNKAASAFGGGVSLSIEAKEGQYLNDILTENGLTNIRYSWIISPTGSGKTNYVSKLKSRKILIVPITGLVNMVHKEYKAVKFDGKHKNYQLIENANFIVTTYASFGKLSDFLEEKGLINQFAAFVDEAHNFTTATSKSFQLKQLTEVLYYLPKYKYFNLLTGTYLPNFATELSTLPIIQINIPKPPKLLYFIDAVDTTKAVEIAIRKSLKRGNFPLVLFNNTSESGRLGTLKALLNDIEGVAYFDSTKKEEKFFKELTEQRTINTSINAIVTTTVLKEGNDILNKYNFDIIICGGFHASDIIQFSNRPRKAEAVNIHIIRNNDRKRSEGFFNPYKCKEVLVERCMARINELTTPTKDLMEEILMENDIKNSIQSLPIIYKDDTYQIDELQLNNYVFNIEKTALNRNDAIMKKALEVDNILLPEEAEAEFNKDGIIRPLNSKSEKSESDKAKAASFRKEKRMEAEAEYIEELEMISTYNHELLHYEKQFIKRKNQLPKPKRKASERFLILSNLGFEPEEAVEVLKDVGLSKSKFQLFINRWKVWQLRNNENYMAENTTFGILIKAMIKTFEAEAVEGVVVNIDTLKAKVKNVLKLDKSFDLDLLDIDNRSDKTLRILRYFFKVESIKKKINNKVECMYSIGNLTFDTNNSYIGKVRLPFSISEEHTTILNSIEINSYGYPSFWD